MAIYDVTVTLREGMPVYPDDPAFRREGGRNLNHLHMGTHGGTHVDAPAHMIEGGKTLTDLAPSVFVGPADVVEIRDPRAITREELERHAWKDVTRVLFKTTNSGTLERGGAFDRGFVYMAADAAEMLAGHGLVLVGVDYLTLDPVGGGGLPAHKALLGAGIVVIEGLDLSGVPPGRYELFCGPLKIGGADGAPARVFLRGPTGADAT
jgi:arylformamidase